MVTVVASGLVMGETFSQNVPPKLLLLSVNGRVQRVFPFRSCHSTCLSSEKGSSNVHGRIDHGELRVCRVIFHGRQVCRVIFHGRQVCHEIFHDRVCHEIFHDRVCHEIFHARRISRVKIQRVERRVFRGRLDDHGHHDHGRHFGYVVPWLLACVSPKIL